MNLQQIKDECEKVAKMKQEQATVCIYRSLFDSDLDERSDTRRIARALLAVIDDTHRSAYLRGPHRRATLDAIERAFNDERKND